MNEPSPSSVPAVPERRYIEIAQNMYQSFTNAYTSNPFSDAFMHPSNVAPMLNRIEHRRFLSHQHTESNVDWQEIFEMLETFATQDYQDSRRQFATVEDANLLFWNTIIEPALMEDWYAWRHQHELSERHRTGIDAKNIRRASHQPTVLDRGRPLAKNKDTKGNLIHVDTGSYMLQHPASHGRERQRQALAMSNIFPPLVLEEGGAATRACPPPAYYFDPMHR